MTVFSVQAPRAVIMIRPHRFAPNPATARDNAFQATDPMRAAFVVSQAAYDECTDLAATLERAGVRVHLFDDIGDDTPDSVFPNNWFSTHSGGHVVTYPMASPSRRKERRSDILEMLKDQYRVQSIVDYSGLEQDGVFLEGTGAMVLDHAERVAYAVKSDRMSDVALERFCTHVGFEPVVFDAADSNGVAVYHTNVLMCIGDAFCLAAFDMITDPARRAEIHDRLTASGRVTINLSERQIREFAGNAIELMGTDGRVLALSRRAFKALTADQIRELEWFVTLVPVDIPTIELAGGSVRCMIAGIHLSPRLETHANTATKKAS
jgi:hypothetical protein